MGYDPDRVDLNASRGFLCFAFADRVVLAVRVIGSDLRGVLNIRPCRTREGRSDPSPLGYTMNDRLRKFMEALSLLARQSDEPETQLTMQARIDEYFAGAVDRQAALESIRKATLAKAEADPDEHEFWDDVERYADQIA